MKPRASAPSTRSGCLLLAQDASSSIVCRSASGSARSGMMSRKTTPFCGKSGTSRTFSFRSTLTPRRAAAGRARRAASRAPGPARPAPGAPRDRPFVARGSARGAPARRPPRAGPPPSSPPAGRRGELLPDHAQGQELVPLKAQDRLQPLDVLLAEEPVAALRPAEREQPLVLEVADLRDRDIREFGLQPCADGPDRQQARSGGCLRGGHFNRKGRRGFPILSSSPAPR